VTIYHWPADRSCEAVQRWAGIVWKAKEAARAEQGGLQIQSSAQDAMASVGHECARGLPPLNGALKGPRAGKKEGHDRSRAHQDHFRHAFLIAHRLHRLVADGRPGKYFIFLSLHRREGSHIDDLLHFRVPRQHMNWLAHAHQNRAQRLASAQFG